MFFSLLLLFVAADCVVFVRLCSVRRLDVYFSIAPPVNFLWHLFCLFFVSMCIFGCFVICSVPSVYFWVLWFHASMRLEHTFDTYSISYVWLLRLSLFRGNNICVGSLERINT